MYTLFFIVLLDLPGIDKVIKLESYPSMDACVSEKRRIMGEMEKVYPNDKTFRLECRLTGQRI
jgi:hypothetical protein